MSRTFFARTSITAHRSVRLAALWITLIALVSGSMMPGAQASTPPSSLLTVHGFLTQPGSDPDLLTVNYTITVQGHRLSNVRLTTKTFAGTPVDPSTIQFQGEDVAPGTVTQDAHSLTVRVGLGADSVNGGMLGTGSYLVSYEQRRPTTAGPYATTSATLTYSADGQPGSVTSNALALTHPDLVLTIPPGSGENRAAFLGTGRVAGYGAFLTNRGAPADAVTLTIALPTGLRLDTADGVIRVDFDRSGDGQVVSVACAHSHSALVTCKLGAVAHNADILLVVPVVATSAAKPGTYGTFHVSVAPTDEPDQHTGDNRLSGRVKFTGVAVLHLALKAAVTKVAVGKTVKISVQIRNDGPQPAGETFSIMLADSPHFKITKFRTSRHVPGPDYMFIDVPPSLGGAVAWNAGTIGPHRTAYATLTLKAISVGTTHVEFVGQSDAADPGCDTGNGPCGEFTRVTLHAVKKTKG